MKTDKTLTELAVELERQAAAKQDYLVPTKALTMTNEAKLQFQNGELKTLAATEHTHGQIASYLDIPKKYYDRMKAEAPELLATNVNNWFNRQGEKRMIRTLDNRVRALVSDKFSRDLENIDAASALIPLLHEQKAVVRSASVTETNLYIKAVLPTMEREVKKGDAVRWGIVLRNSEVGLGALVVQPFVERLVCTNGLIVEDGKFSARHVGRKHESDSDYAHVLAQDTIDAEGRAIKLRLRDVVRATLTDEFFAKYITKFQEATEQKMTGNPVEAVEVLANKFQSFGLTEGERNGVLTRLIEGADLSRYGLLNAVTNLAEAAETYERATELERLGGKILDLPQTAWKEIALAA